MMWNGVCQFDTIFSDVWVTVKVRARLYMIAPNYEQQLIIIYIFIIQISL